MDKVLTVDQLDDLVTQVGVYLLKQSTQQMSKRAFFAAGVLAAGSWYSGYRTYRAYIQWKINTGTLVQVKKP